MWTSHSFRSVKSYRVSQPAGWERKRFTSTLSSSATSTLASRPPLVTWSTRWIFDGFWRKLFVWWQNSAYYMIILIKLCFLMIYVFEQTWFKFWTLSWFWSFSAEELTRGPSRSSRRRPRSLARCVFNLLCHKLLCHDDYCGTDSFDVMYSV